MNNSFFRLNDFINEKNFNSLKENFKRQDIDFFNPSVKNNFNSINPKISIYEILKIDEEISQTITVEKEFIKDFILSGITSVVENEINDFNRVCYDKGLFVKDQKKGYLLLLTKKLETDIIQIEKADYLDEKVRELLVSVVQELIVALNRNLNLTYRKIPKKIKFNWRKNKIEALFYLLWKSNKIVASKPADIGNMLDFCFEYQDDYGNYIEMKDSRKEFSDFGRAKGDKKPIEEIKKELMKEDFYNH